MSPTKSTPDHSFRQSIAIVLAVMAIGVSGTLFVIGQTVQDRADINVCAIKGFMEKAVDVRAVPPVDKQDKIAIIEYQKLIDQLASPPAEECDRILERQR